MLADVQEIVFDNGFRALLLERHNLPVAASTIWYRVGSRDERTGETGLSHFLEHMMFKGTDRYAKGEIDLITAKLGGSNNAFTSSDVTGYYFSLASDRWQTALEIEASRMRDCLLDDDEFAAEKNVVLEELAMGQDDPWSKLYQTTETVAYQVHPYHHPVIGWRDDLEALTAADMRSYYDRHYGPNRAFLVAVGDFSAAQVADRIHELFEPLPASAETRRPVLPEPRQLGPRHDVEYSSIGGEITRMTMTVKTCAMGEDDDFVLDVISHVLGASKNSRLYKKLVLESQLASALWVTNEVRLDPGVFCISVELRRGAEPQRVEDVVREELAELARRGVRAAELTAARTQLRSAFLFEEETVLDLAMRLGRFEALTAAGYGCLDGVFDRYDAIRSTQIKQVVRRYFDEFSWSTALLLPEPKARR